MFLFYAFLHHKEFALSLAQQVNVLLKWNWLVAFLKISDWSQRVIFCYAQLCNSLARKSYRSCCIHANICRPQPNTTSFFVEVVIFSWFHFGGFFVNCHNYQLSNVVIVVGMFFCDRLHASCKMTKNRTRKCRCHYASWLCKLFHFNSTWLYYHYSSNQIPNPTHGGQISLKKIINNQIDWIIQAYLVV